MRGGERLLLVVSVASRSIVSVLVDESMCVIVSVGE